MRHLAILALVPGEPPRRSILKMGDDSDGFDTRARKLTAAFVSA